VEHEVAAFGVGVEVLDPPDAQAARPGRPTGLGSSSRGRSSTTSRSP
jgi:hypothetical protein